MSIPQGASSGLSLLVMFILSAGPIQAATGWGVSSIFTLDTRTISAPTGVTASKGTFYNKVTLSWNSATSASGYQVWRHTADNSASATQITNITSTNCNDYSAAAGQVYYYWVKATNATGVSAFSSSDSGWRVRVRSDPAIIDSAGNWYVWLSGSGYQRMGPFYFGVSGPGFARGSAEASTPVAADFDGDGYTDIAIVSNIGTWYLWLSSIGYQMSGPYNLGVSGTPLAADFDGDGYADPAMVDNNDYWYVWFTSTGYQRGGPYSLGVSGIPLAADFDGDGYADPAVVDATGGWYVWFTSRGYQMGGPYSLGISGTPVAGDFDADGYADPAVVDDNGNWYVFFTSAGYQMSGPYNLGISGTPIVADFDGR